MKVLANPDLTKIPQEKTRLKNVATSDHSKAEGVWQTRWSKADEEYLWEQKELGLEYKDIVPILKRSIKAMRGKMAALRKLKEKDIK